MEGRGSAAGHLAVVAMVLVLVMAPGALAANHIVGGAQAWDIPAANDLTYYDATWAPSQTFAVGDTLQFQYSAAGHDVVQYATSAEYTACAGTAVNTYRTGNDMITLSEPGTYYFICSFTGHCTLGMKVSVTVAAVAPASPPTTTPTPSPPSTTPTPSPPSTTPSPPAVISPPPPPSGTGGNAANLSMAGLIIAALVASLAFLV